MRQLVVACRMSARRFVAVVAKAAAVVAIGRKRSGDSGEHLLYVARTANTTGVDETKILFASKVFYAREKGDVLFSHTSRKDKKKRVHSCCKYG